MSDHPSNLELIALLTRIERKRLSSLYNRHGLEIGRPVEELVRAIRLDGSNSFVSIVRGGEGVSYEELVKDVASKMKVKFKQNETVVEIERKCLFSLINKKDPKSKKKIEELLAKAGVSAEVTGAIIGGAFSTAILFALIGQLGPVVASDVIQQTIAQVIMRQAAAAAILRAPAAAGATVPVLNVALLGLFAVSLAGPAYRKTIPTVLEIAMLRIEFEVVDTCSVPSQAV